MLGNLTPVLFFVAIGIGWRAIKPQGISADALQKGLSGLVHLFILPVAVFFTILDLPLNEAALRILLYVLGTTAIVLAVAWLWLSRTTLPGKAKGALLISSGFGNVFFLGIPLHHLFFPEWTGRVAVEYGLVANVLLLFTAGAVLSRSLVETGKGRFAKSLAVLEDYRIWLKEPLLWAGVGGLILNLSDVGKPQWIGTLEGVVYAALVPLLLLPTALALNWNSDWKRRIVSVLPAAGIQLIVAPLIMWGFASLFGSAGVKTTQVLLLDAMMPATVLGFLVCERYKLDTAMYAIAFSVTTVLAMITVPALSALIL